jgi:hypothetical protein
MQRPWLILVAFVLVAIIGPLLPVRGRYDFMGGTAGSGAKTAIRLCTPPGVPQTQLSCNVLNLKCGGLLSDRHEPQLTRRFVVYYCSAVYTSKAKPVHGKFPNPGEFGGF